MSVQETNSPIDQPPLVFSWKAFRHDPDAFASALAKRHLNFDFEAYKKLVAEHKDWLNRVQDWQEQRNGNAKKVGQAKACGEDASELIAAMSTVTQSLKEGQKRLDDLADQLAIMEQGLPNPPHDSVPEGRDEDDNVCVRTWGDPCFLGFREKDHVALAEGLGGLDIAAGAKLAGSRFAVMSGQVARLHRALAQFMLDVHTKEHGYIEHNVPLLLSDDCFYSTGQLPKFEDDQYFVTNMEGESSSRLGLLPTAEVALTNLVKDQVLDADVLPLRWVAHTPCFRREAGSYGRDTHGLIRMHQFEKVELVQIVRPEDSYEALESLTHHAEVILQRLNLPYQVVALCGGDLGFSAAKTYDLNVWLPASRSFREISSCSNTEAFQAMRMKARFRRQHGEKPMPVHTLNGSGLAVGRALVAVLENYQNADGSVTVPEALQPYMGCERLETAVIK